MHGIEEQLAATMRGRADEQVDSDALLGAALARGRARVRRRQLTMALSGAGVAGATAAVLAAAPLGLTPGHGSGGSYGATGKSNESANANGPLALVDPPGVELGSPSPPVRGHYTVPALPVAAGVPGAAQQPNAVGSDPRLIHFGVGTLSLPTGTAFWSVQGGVEALDFSSASPAGYTESVRVRMAHGQTVPRPEQSDLDPSAPSESTRSVKVGDHTATLTTQTSPDLKAAGSASPQVNYVLRWQPAPGVAVELSSGLNQTDLLAVAKALRFDTASRCGIPLRLTALPPGAQATACEVFFPGLPGQASGAPQPILTIGKGTKDAITLTVLDKPGPAASLSASPTTLPNGWPAGIVEGQGGATMQIFDAGGFGVGVAATGGYGAAEVALVGEGLRKSGDLTKPATWPADPLQ
jgi:hypothetical protein